ncbi:unnamed protein product, partial [Gadus morhua 'NCC']
HLDYTHCWSSTNTTQHLPAPRLHPLLVLHQTPPNASQPLDYTHCWSSTNTTQHLDYTHCWSSTTPPNTSQHLDYTHCWSNTTQHLPAPRLHPLLVLHQHHPTPPSP